MSFLRSTRCCDLPKKAGHVQNKAGPDDSSQAPDARFLGQIVQICKRRDLVFCGGYGHIARVFQGRVSACGSFLVSQRSAEQSGPTPRRLAPEISTQSLCGIP